MLITNNQKIMEFTQEELVLIQSALSVISVKLDSAQQFIDLVKKVTEAIEAPKGS